MKKLTTLAMTLAVALGMSACSASFSTNSNAPANNANANKPANAANNATNSGNANKSNTTSNTNAAKTEVKDEKANKPANAKKQPNAKTVPAEWVYYSDDIRGYGFSLPKGSESSNDTTDGIDTFVGITPEKITVIVYAFKDKTMTKEDLLNFAEAALKNMGETITVGKLAAEDENYAIADADSTSQSGKSKMNILVATDVTDNYVMIAHTDEKSYEAQKATMEMIWSSFEMYSGGGN